MSGAEGVNTSSGLPGGEETVGALGVPLASADGVWIVGLLILVTVLAGLPLGVTLTNPETRRAVTWTSAGLLLGFSFLAGFSLGLTYLPVPILLLVSAASDPVRAQGVAVPDCQGESE